MFVEQPCPSSLAPATDAGVASTKLNGSDTQHNTLAERVRVLKEMYSKEKEEKEAAKQLNATLQREKDEESEKRHKAE
jgi:ABC-type hemin transport system substrate-binding protein